MAGASAFLLDTNIVLHITRKGSPVAAAVDAAFGLSASPFKPAICEVTIAELWAFAESRTWGDDRRALLERVIRQLVVIPISAPGIHRRWSALYSYARGEGLAIQTEQNDVWIAAAAHVAGLTLLSADATAFKPLRGTTWLEVVLIDPQSGAVVP